MKEIIKEKLKKVNLENEEFVEQNAVLQSPSITTRETMLFGRG